VRQFEVLFLTEAREFLLNLDLKSREKIIFNIDKTQEKEIEKAELIRLKYFELKKEQKNGNKK